MPPAMTREVFRTAFGRGLTMTIGGLCALATVLTAVGDGVRAALIVAPWLALIALLCWASFWRPRVEVSDAGVTLVNVTRTIAVPWPALQDVDTQWALRLSTAYGRFAAWAAPAPGLRSAVTTRRLGDGDDAHVFGSPRTPDRHAGASALRPGDLADTSSGEAAAMVRRRWEKLVADGHLDDPVLEHERPVVRWHLDTALGVVALVGLGVVTAITVR